MKRFHIGALFSVLLLLPLSGCTAIGDKTASLSIVYGATAVLSLLLLIGCCVVPKKKDPWFLLLFTSVFVVNVGYFTLAVSQNLNEALLANRLAYLGSVFLPLSMLVIILGAVRISIPKSLIVLLLTLSIVVFLIAASPGYLDIYYKEVTFEKINGVTVLNKVYGPLHQIYLFYLLGYFGAMIAVIINAIRKKRIESASYSVVLATAVFVNLGVWLIEQLVRIDFEILSISYIISECFLLGLNLVMTERETHPVQPAPLPMTPVMEVPPPSPAEEPKPSLNEDLLHSFIDGIKALTPTEKLIYEAYIAGQSTKEIMAELNIKENTLKFHNKHIYSKLGVSSRKQLIERYKQTLQ